MGVPALLVDFPPPSSTEYDARARLVGRQWPVFWHVGNVFFRPISTLGIFGYAYTAWSAGARGGLGDWRVYAISSACHLLTVVHSAVNMQPINVKIDSLRDGKGGEDSPKAEQLLRSWIRGNTVRMITPLVAGSLALWELLRTK